MKRIAIVFIFIMLLSVANGVMQSVAYAEPVTLSLTLLKALGVLLVGAGLTFETEKDINNCSFQLLEDLKNIKGCTDEYLQGLLILGAMNTVRVSQDLWDFVKDRAMVYSETVGLACTTGYNKLIDTIFSENIIYSTDALNFTIEGHSITFSDITTSSTKAYMLVDGLILEEELKIKEFTYDGIDYELHLTPFFLNQYSMETYQGYRFENSRQRLENGDYVNFFEMNITFTDGNVFGFPIGLYQKLTDGGLYYIGNDIAPTNYVLENTDTSITIGGIPVSDGTWDEDLKDGEKSVPIPLSFTDMLNKTSTDVGNAPTTPPTPPDNINVNPLDMRDRFENKLNLNVFKNAFQRLQNIDTNKGEPPVIYINLHDLYEVGNGRLYNIKNPYEDEETELFNFDIFNEIKFMGIPVIDYFRNIIGYGMILMTFMYCWDKIIPSKVVE